MSLPDNQLRCSRTRPRLSHYVCIDSFLARLQAKEIHVCGSLEAEALVRRLCEKCGDDFELRTYERMSALKVVDEPLGSYANVKPGDCVVAFSRKDIFSIREAIERLTKHKCCVVYGQLPPETRAKQASLFNEEDSGYDVLVASDAIGMGLNLNIRRIIFHSIDKVQDTKQKQKGRVPETMMKQIAGRAGRRSSQYKDLGEVTCLEGGEGMEWLRSSLASPVEQVAAAGLFPAVEHLQAYSDLLDRLEDEEEEEENAEEEAAFEEQLGSAVEAEADEDDEEDNDEQEDDGVNRVDNSDGDDDDGADMDAEADNADHEGLTASKHQQPEPVIVGDAAQGLDWPPAEMHSASAGGFVTYDASGEKHWVEPFGGDDDARVAAAAGQQQIAAGRAWARGRRQKEPRRLADTLASFMKTARMRGSEAPSSSSKGDYFLCRHDEISVLANRLHETTGHMPLDAAFIFAMAVSYFGS